MKAEILLHYPVKGEVEGRGSYPENSARRICGEAGSSKLIIGGNLCLLFVGSETSNNDDTLATVCRVTFSNVSVEQY